jgi:hypothetical protein
MDEIFREHLAYMLGGIVVGSALAFWPRQSTWAKRLSRTLCALALLYPALITLIFLVRHDLGESYAYHILGGLVAGALGVLAFIVLVAWCIAYFRGRVRG